MSDVRRLVLVTLAIIAVCVIAAWLAAGAVASTKRMECHHNQRSQLVCRQCWTDTKGQVRCSQPRIQ